MSSGWLLGIDFGTSNTAAAHINEMTGVLQAVPLSHNSNVMSSSVFVTSPVQIEVGDVAVNKAAVDPASFITAPKRTLTAGQTSFTIGHWEVPAHNVVAGVLRAVVTKAQTQHQGQAPAGLVLTHPENWSAEQIAELTNAAYEIGYPPNLVRAVSEPRAAAHYYGKAGKVRPGERVAVFDFGGGTLDVAVLAATPAGSFDIIAAQGDNALGGRNFDAAVRRWVEDELSDRNPELLAAVRNGMSARDERSLDGAIRAAKEVLSEAPQASIEVSAGGMHDVLLLTRSEFDGLIDAEVTRAASLANSVLATAGGGVSAIYLTGGSSRIPLVHRRLQELGPVATLDDPKTVVAQGALIAALRQGAYEPQTAAPQHAVSHAEPVQQPATVVSTGTQQQSAGGVPQAAKGIALSRKWWLVGGIAAAAVIAAAAITAVTLTSGDGDKRVASTVQPSSAVADSGSQSPSAGGHSVSEVLAALPASLRQAMTCTAPPGSHSDGIDAECTIVSSNPLIAGLFKPGAVDPTFSVGLVEAPERQREDTKKDLAGGMILKDDGSVFVSYGVLVADSLSYLNLESGLHVGTINEFKSKQDALTFLSRAGL